MSIEKRSPINLSLKVLFVFVLLSGYPGSAIMLSAQTEQKTITAQQVLMARKINETTIEISLTNNQRQLLDFYDEDIFRLFQDNTGGTFKDPEARPLAKILIENPRKPLGSISLLDQNNKIRVSTTKVLIEIDKTTGLFKVTNKLTANVVLEEATAVKFEKSKVLFSLKESTQEYFYGGGVQNGRFSHKGKIISIENQNSWTDGGVASPSPFYWSSNGYGLLWHTFKKGSYDFGAKEKGMVKLSHEENYLDVFITVGDSPDVLLNQFYQLTGNPVLLPKFGFYQGHLNAYNRDFWKPDEKGILFEDGKRYTESQKDNGGTKESLNGEKNNYQFSARAVIDRYKKNDMPFGWILPNDGYGAGYGQTATLDGNIENLKSLGEYARKNGVEIGLWTQSDLHPKPGVSALLQRDIIKEVKDAGVRVLKTDVAWVGAGYSFGLNGVSDVAQIMSNHGNNSRPFIISLDGWAGTQRYAGIWSGDQTGGVWEYIRFHIPTYIGSGLSGQPNITSDMDGIFGGKNNIVNTRDFQWKTFTPMQLNMDGWGANEKYPQALGEPITSINRNYLKLKSELTPYTYSIAKEAVSGLPMIRAMFLDYPNSYTKGSSTQYQFMYGPNFLIAPIYQATKADELGNDIRNGIYLPEGTWIDYFTGEKFEGGTVINNFSTPLWKLPVFVKNGAIIPLTDANNNVSEINNSKRIYELYPFGTSSFTEYDDDGTTEQYKLGKGASTLIEVKANHQLVTATIHATKGTFNGLVKIKSTEFRINVTEKPTKLMARIGTQSIALKEVNSLSDLAKRENTFFYDTAPNLNKFSTKGTEFEKVTITKNPLLYVRLSPTDVTVNEVQLTIQGFVYEPIDQQRKTAGKLTMPQNASVLEKNAEAFTLVPTWAKVEHADFYEIDFDGMHYTTIKDTALRFEGLNAETAYAFKLRAVNKDGHSDWTTIKATTKANPLQFAIPGISAETTAENQEGSEVDQLFDFDEGNMWHTKWGAKAIPFDMIVDLKSSYQLDRLQYLPRNPRGNGTLSKGTVFFSDSKENWKEAGTINWNSDQLAKSFKFDSGITARFLKITFTEGLGDFGSGRELYVFKVPGTDGLLPGDINNDHVIDKNDLISYTNYVGLRKGDADFEGYISNGDLNKNNLIDAYDISVVATQLEGGIEKRQNKPLTGKLDISTAKKEYKTGEIISITIKGLNLQSVNALSFALPYNSLSYEFIDIKSQNTKQMDNLSNDRLHTDGKKVLYPTFVNVGDREPLAGSSVLFVLRFRAKAPVKFDLKATDILLVDKDLKMIQN